MRLRQAQSLGNHLTKFSYSGIGKDGLVVKGELEAQNKSDAVSKIMASGVTPTNIIVIRGVFSVKDIVRVEARPLNMSEAASFTSDLARLLHSGFALRQALIILSISAESDTLRRLAKRAESEVAEGKSLSRVLSNEKGYIAKALAGILQAGQASGKLAEILSSASVSFKRSAEFREKLKSALIYPAVIAFLIVITLFIFFSVVMPQLEPLFEGARDRLPTSTKILIGFGEISEWLLPVFLVLILGLVIFGKRFSFLKKLARNISSFAQLSKISGRIGLDASFASYAQILSLLLNAGVSLPAAQGTAVNAISIPLLRDKVQKIGDDLRRGQKLSDCLGKVSSVPDILISVIKVGEASGKLPAALEDAGVILSERAQRKTDRLLAALTPAITIMLGLIVAAIVGSLFLGISSLTDGTEF